jgi:hypothetical protein
MKLRGQQSILLVSSLVLYCSVGWTQTFNTNIEGIVITCTRKDYLSYAVPVLRTIWIGRDSDARWRIREGGFQ